MTEELTLGSTIGAVKNLFAPKAPTFDDLIESIHEFEVVQNGKRSHASDHLYITDFAYRPCVRRLAYYLLQPEIRDKAKSPAVILDMDAGTMIHEYLQERVLGPMGILEGDWVCSKCGHVEHGKKPTAPCFGQIKVLDIMSDEWTTTTCKESGMTWGFKEQHIKLMFHGIGVTGRPDGTLIVIGRYLLEIKSTEDEKFQAINEPKDYHVFQASVYGEALDFDQVIILYVNRNHWDQMKAFVVDVDKGATESIKNLCGMVRLLLDNEDPMRAIPVCNKRSAWKAKECGCQNICFPLKRKSVTKKE